jgi:1-acyl-sn-glycerol-3-phosphate acyltransferase
VFPEGTTTRGETVEAFHTALFEPALRASVAVQGTLLAYAPRSSRDPADMAAWTGDAAFVPHLYRLFRGRGLDVRAVFQPQGAASTDRRAAANQVRDWMTETLGTLGKGKGVDDPAPSGRRFKRTAARFSLPRAGDRIFR